MIRGDNLTNTIAVSFNGVAAQFEITGDIIPWKSMLYVSVPIGAKTGPISVTTLEGTSSTTTPFTIIEGNPVIEDFSPSSGPPGTLVIISGQNLRYITSVFFNGQICDQWGPGSNATDYSIFAHVPASATTGPVTVKGPHGDFSSQTNFTVTPTPPLAVIYWPAEANTGDGVTITVNDSAQVTDVRLNGTSLSFSRMGPAILVVLIPDTATSGPLSVLSADQTLTSPLVVRVPHPLPVITSVSPTSGPAGTVVQVQGKNLQGTPWIWLGTVQIRCTDLSDSLISFVVPPGAGSGEIRVDSLAGPAAFFTVTSAFTTRPGSIGGPVPTTAPTWIIVVTPTLNRRPAQPASFGAAGSDAAVQLAWRTDGAFGMILETTDDLGSGTWRAVGSPFLPTSRGTKLVVPAYGSRAFFRLRQVERH